MKINEFLWLKKVCASMLQSKKGVVHVYVCEEDLPVNAHVCFGTGTQAVGRHTHVQEAYL